VAYPDLQALAYAGNGIVGAAVQAAIDNASAQSPADKLVGIYGQNYRNWLVRKT
jgi:hypothetical protein